MGATLLIALAGYSLVGFAGNASTRRGNHTGGGSDFVQYKIVTVPEKVKVYKHGHVSVKRIAVVKRIYARPATVIQTRTVQTPGGTQVITRRVIRLRPVYRRHVVIVHGKAVTVRQVVTDKQLATITNEHTSTLIQEQTVDQTATVTRTQTMPAQTVSQTTTVTRTETAPAQTVTVTGPTSTIHVTSTVTVAGPPSTITVTVTSPGH
jgi:hypothetical protein